MVRGTSGDDALELLSQKKATTSFFFLKQVYLLKESENSNKAFINN